MEQAHPVADCSVIVLVHFVLHILVSGLTEAEITKAPSDPGGALG